jgi:NDP-sugar pyrophosphorylase family protein
MEMKKYEFTGQELSTGLKQIRALKDFGDVKKGQIGGWLEAERNLDHKGDCWVFESGIVWDNGRVEGDALLKDGCVYENAIIAGSVTIDGGAYIYGNSEIENELVIYGGCVKTK